jgi:gentisate 1,2-dioxygenase
MVNEHRKLSALYNTLQELRVTEAKANTNAMLAVYEKVERLLDQIQELRK